MTENTARFCLLNKMVKSITLGGKPVIISKEQGRNDPCNCGSGKKYKKCCLTQTT